MKKNVVEIASAQQILRATVACIARHGFERASMQEIADLANVSKGLLHYHFHSKEELVMNAIKNTTTRIVGEMKKRLHDREDAAERFVLAADDLYELLISDKETVAFLTEMYATSIYNERIRGLMKTYKQDQVELIHEVLLAALGDTEVSNPAALRTMADMVQTALQGLSVDSIFAKNEKELVERFESIRTSFIMAAQVMLMEGS